ncbi:MAG: radical SAM protein [Chloroflexi bacterium]|nr:MAG: radical SAM protein [Chloroflexota bacterium]
MTTTTLVTLPRSIYIEPTSRCNEFCQQCPRTLLSREDDRDLSFEKFREIVDQFPILERVVLHGLGEPLLNSELPLMIRYLKERGTYVLFNSNGIVLTDRKGQELIDAGLDEYRLSMDGATRETYARVRGVDAFDKIWRNVQAFVALQKERQAEKPAVSLWFTAMRTNLHELPALVELAGQYGVGEVYMQRFVYFEKGLATEQQALFHRATAEEMEIVHRCERMSKERGIRFRAAGAASPLESITRDILHPAAMYSPAALHPLGTVAHANTTKSVCWETSFRSRLPLSGKGNATRLFGVPLRARRLLDIVPNAA